MGQTKVAFEEASTSDLVVDAIYEAGLAMVREGRQKLWVDPLPSLLGVKASGGFRVRSAGGRVSLAVLYSDFSQPDWPDSIDLELGTWTYFGDNRHPGSELHEKTGNRYLRDWFSAAHSTPPRRNDVPPIFVFTRGERGKDLVFRGLVVPGSPVVPPGEDLVALWRASHGHRFQNYRAVFSILDAGHIPRAWLADLGCGSDPMPFSPAAWNEWRRTGRACLLRAPRTRSVRTRAEQLPHGEDLATLQAIHSYFEADPHAFEHFAADLFRLMDTNCAALDVTRPSRDGGRDAVGWYRIGTEETSIRIDFALEAKCYTPGVGSVGVRDVSRLISRLRHRQFGVLVTTSYLHEQAYEEIVSDGHPVLVLAGIDVVRILSRTVKGPAATAVWLASRFPRGTPAAG